MHFVIVSILSAVLLVSYPKVSQAATWSSASLVAEFSEDGKLLQLENSLTGERLNLRNGGQFSFVTEAGEISPKNSSVQSVRKTPTGPEIHYAHPQFEITVTYQLKPDDHFLQKHVRVRHLGNRPFTIKHCSLHRWQLDSQPGELIPFRHGQCITYFLRKQGGGFFFGVQTAFEDILPANAEAMDLAYPVNIIFNPRCSYEMETAYWGVYRQTGRYAPKFPDSSQDKESIGSEVVFSQVSPDMGEAEAMLKMVEKLAPPPRGVTVSFNGYTGGLHYGEYGDPDGLQRAEWDVDTLRIVKEMIGVCYVQPAGTWFGAYRQLTSLTSKDERIRIPAARQKLIEWMNENGMKPLGWACLKTIMGWLTPRPGPYLQNDAEWLANPQENCPANPAFMQWLTRILINDLRNGFAGFIEDEPGPTIPRYHLECQKTSHQHVPGDVSYAYFYRARELFRRLRETFGSDFELQGMRPQMDTGIWHASYLNSVMSLSEQSGKPADQIRQWARLRRDYFFVPSYMDQQFINPGLEPTDELMLSALAVSSNYLFAAPIKDLKKHIRHITSTLSRSIAEDLRSFPEQEKTRVRYWLDWARQHSQYMDKVIDLPEWPRSGSPDGYLRLKEGRGFAFLFNSTDAQQSITVPLDESVELNAKTSYRLKQLHPLTAKDLGTYKSEARVLLRSRTAYLIEINPVADR